MTELTADTSKKTPGIIIFVSILNFISTAFFFLLSAIALIAIIFGNVMGIYDFVTRQINHYSPAANLSVGFNVLFGFILAVAVFFTLFHLLVGIGLLNGNKIFWYIQIALCVVGLLGFPIGTILNTVILVFFFQSPVRDFFKV